MRKQLQDAILLNSESDITEHAVTEWMITGFKVDDSCSSECVCGKENIKYLFRITNSLNMKCLKPIGSRCIKQFGRSDLSDEVDAYEQMSKLVDAVKSRKFISLTDGLFTRKLLKHLYENGCFVETLYNGYDSYRDYKFMLDMFNKKSSITYKQQSKISAIIMNSIIPYCKHQLEIMEADE